MAAIGNCAVLPVNVLGAKGGDVGLCAAQVPEQFIIGAGCRIEFPPDDFLMLVKSNGAFLLMFYRWPVRFWQHRPREPVHIHRVVVDAAQINIGRDRAGLHRGEKKFRRGFNQLVVAEQVESFVADGGLPAKQGLAGFDGDDLLHDVLPGAGGQRRVAMLQIDLGDLQVHGGLAVGVVSALHELPGFIFAGSLKAGAFAGLGVHAVEHSSACAPANQAITCFHNVFHAIAKITKAFLESLASTGRVKARYAEL